MEMDLSSGAGPLPGGDPMPRDDDYRALRVADVIDVEHHAWHETVAWLSARLGG